MRSAIQTPDKTIYFFVVVFCWIYLHNTTNRIFEQPSVVKGSETIKVLDKTVVSGEGSKLNIERETAGREEYQVKVTLFFFFPSHAGGISWCAAG